MIPLLPADQVVERIAAIEIGGHIALQRHLTGNDGTGASQVELDVWPGWRSSGTCGPERNGSSFHGPRLTLKLSGTGGTAVKSKRPSGPVIVEVASLSNFGCAVPAARMIVEQDRRTLHRLAAIAELTADGCIGPQRQRSRIVATRPGTRRGRSRRPIAQRFPTVRPDRGTQIDPMSRWRTSGWSASRPETRILGWRVASATRTLEAGRPERIDDHAREGSGSVASGNLAFAHRRRRGGRPGPS